MIQDFYIKQSDTAEAIVVLLKYDDGTTVAESLVDAEVEFHMANAAGGIIIAAGVGSVIDDTQKLVGYQWQDGDTDIFTTSTAPHQAEFQMTYSDGRIETFPNRSNINIHIFPQIA